MKTLNDEFSFISDGFCSHISRFIIKFNKEKGKEIGSYEWILAMRGLMIGPRQTQTGMAVLIWMGSSAKM